jgi:hypothetical protein
LQLENFLVNSTGCNHPSINSLSFNSGILQTLDPTLILKKISGIYFDVDQNLFPLLFCCCDYFLFIISINSYQVLAEKNYAEKACSSKRM